MQLVECHKLSLVSGGSHVSIEVKIPTSGTIICVDLMSQILLGQLDIPLFAQALNLQAEQFDKMRVTTVSVVID